MHTQQASDNSKASQLKKIRQKSGNGKNNLQEEHDCDNVGVNKNSIDNSNILQMQSVLGNRNTLQYVNQLSSMNVQAKLKVGQVSDKFELEADKTAEKVLSSLNNSKEDNSSKSPANNEGSDISIQKKQNNSNGSSINKNSDHIEKAIHNSSGRGQNLDNNVKNKMGKALNFDLSNVKIHTDSQSERLSNSLSARAFTSGRDIYFNKGEYKPGSKDGQKLIAHELTHVVQQSNGSTNTIQRWPSFGGLFKRAKTATGQADELDDAKDVGEQGSAVADTVGNIAGISTLGNDNKTSTNSGYASNSLGVLGNMYSLGKNLLGLKNDAMSFWGAKGKKDPLKQKLISEGNDVMEKRAWWKGGGYVTNEGRLNEKIGDFSRRLAAGPASVGEKNTLEAKIKELKDFRESRNKKSEARHSMLSKGWGATKDLAGLAGNALVFAGKGTAATGIGLALGGASLLDNGITAFKSQRTMGAMKDRFKDSEFAAKNAEGKATGDFDEWGAKQKLQDVSVSDEEKLKIRKELLAYHLKNTNKDRRNSALVNAGADVVGIGGSIAGLAGTGLGAAIGGVASTAIKGGQTLFHKAFQFGKDRYYASAAKRYQENSYPNTPEGMAQKKADYAKYIKTSKGIEANRAEDAETMLKMKASLRAGDDKGAEEYNSFIEANGVDKDSLDALDSKAGLTDAQRAETQKSMLMNAQSKRGDFGENIPEIVKKVGKGAATLTKKAWGKVSSLWK